MGTPRLTRRGLIAGAGAVGAGIALGGVELERALGDPSGSGQVPFDGPHQAGIATAAQDRLHFAAFDVTVGRRKDLRELLHLWTEAARRMTAGDVLGEVDTPGAPPVDTGEALGLPPSRLTVTFGFGPSLFDGRFGLAPRRPAALAELPPLPGDELEPDRSGGDLCVQACADDPQVVFHAVRNLARIGPALSDQEATIGRVKDSGAPLGEKREFDPVDLSSKRIPMDAHIRLAAPSTNGASRSCAAATRSRTAWTSGSASSTRASSSSASSATRPRSSSCSGGSGARTR